MGRPKRLGRGLEDISHYFISQDYNRSDPTQLIVESGQKYQVATVVDLFDPYRSALFTTNLCIELCKNGVRTLLIDSDIRFPGVAFMLKRSIPGYSLRHYFQDQYEPCDLIYMGPFGLKVLAPRLSVKDIHKMKMPEVYPMIETLISIEKEIDIIIVRQCEDRLWSLIDNAIFFVPASNSGMIRAYRSIKSFTAGKGSKVVGIVIANTMNEPAAMKAYKKMCESVEMFCGIGPYLCGYLSDVSMESLSADSPCLSTILSHMIKAGLNNRSAEKDGMLFFERLRYLSEDNGLSGEEIANLLV